MMDATTIPANTVSFRDYLFKDKRNKTLLILAAVAMVIQWGVFKWFYPFASYIHGDSFSYIKAADQNLSINTYLIGYSKFLRLFSVFSNSDYALTTFQYILIQGSGLLLLFTIFYFYNPGKITRIILLCFLVLNPLFLHLANLVSSDGFFLAISMIWFALLLLLTHKPSQTIIFWHAIILFIAFTVRYNAMMYPFISLLAFYLSKISIKQKLIGFGTAIAFCGLFVIFTSYQYKKLTGNWQYSPFTGWQFANNAMYAYRYVDKKDRKPVPEKYKILDKMICDFFDSTRDVNKFPSEAAMASTYYMWSHGMPLMQYKNQSFKNDTSASEFKKWASMGPFYKKYGTYIINQYRWHYIRYYIWPNSMKYYTPLVEFLGSYNSGKSYVTEETKEWFGYKTTSVKKRISNDTFFNLEYYPILSGIVNIIMIGLLIYYTTTKGWKHDYHFRKCILAVTAVWILNAAFTIGSSSAALRFQSFPLILTAIFTIVITDWLINLLSTTREKEVGAAPYFKTTISS